MATKKRTRRQPLQEHAPHLHPADRQAQFFKNLFVASKKRERREAAEKAILKKRLELQEKFIRAQSTLLKRTKTSLGKEKKAHQDTKFKLGVSRKDSAILRKERNTAVKERDHYRKVAGLDPTGVTDLHTRRYGEKRQNELHREKISYTLIFIDIDHFKDFNDKHGGHAGGDAVLRQLSDGLKQSNLVRETDIFYRYAGDEFAIILPSLSDKRTAYERAESIKLFANSLSIHLPDGKTAKTKLSIGVAIHDHQNNPHEMADVVVERADAAMFGSKDRGRNRVSIEDTGLFYISRNGEFQSFAVHAPEKGHARKEPKAKPAPR